MYSNSSRWMRGGIRLLRQHEPAPGDIAGIERMQVGQELLAHGRADAVGADQQIGLLGAAAVAEMRRSPAGRVCSKPLQADAAVIVRRREARRAADAIEPVPGGQRLRASASMTVRPVGVEDLAAYVISTPRSAVSIPSARIARGTSSGWATMPAPRPESSLVDPLVDRRRPSRALRSAARRTGRSSSRRSRWLVRRRPVLFPLLQNML